MANEEVDRKAEILNAAVELFGTLGYYGTSLQKIADRVGLTKAGSTALRRQQGGSAFLRIGRSLRFRNRRHSDKHGTRAAPADRGYVAQDRSGERT